MNSPYIHERDLPELDLKKWSVLGYIHMADRIVETEFVKKYPHVYCPCIKQVEIKTAYWSFPSLEMTIKMRMGLCEGCLTMYYWTDIA